MHYGVHSYYDNNKEENGNINNYKRVTKKLYNKEVNIRRKRLENLYDQERILYNRYLIKSGISKRYDYRTFGTVTNIVNNQDVNSMIREMDLIKQVNNKQNSSPSISKNENIYSLPKDSYHNKFLDNKEIDKKNEKSTFSNIDDRIISSLNQNKKNLLNLSEYPHQKMEKSEIVNDSESKNSNLDENKYKMNSNSKYEADKIISSSSQNKYTNKHKEMNVNNDDNKINVNSSNLSSNMDYSHNSNSNFKRHSQTDNEIEKEKNVNKERYNNLDLEKSPLLQNKGEFKNYGKQNMVFVNPYYENNKLDIFEKKLINYNTKLESLRMQEYTNSKKIQDELLENINNKLNSINNSISKSMYSNNALTGLNSNNMNNYNENYPNQFNQMNRIIYNQINNEFSRMGQLKDFRDIGLVNMNSQYLPIIK